MTAPHTTDAGYEEPPLPLRTEDIGFLHRVGLSGVDLATLWKLCDMALAAHRLANALADMRRQRDEARAEKEALELASAALTPSPEDQP